MSKLKEPINLETAFESYVLKEILGEGGSGRVYGGETSDGLPVAVKILTSDKVTNDKRKRFKNEIAFLTKTKHRNIVAVTDYGVSKEDGKSSPFYVMQRYDACLRNVKLNDEEKIDALKQILDGVEAAHMLGVVHRDLKPENILYENKSNTFAIADFGIASFTDDVVATLVETGLNQRLANFIYAAPEQKQAGVRVGKTADIYALGLILNELFTGSVPHGTDFSKVESFSKEFGYLDQLIEKMISQSPENRPQDINDIKSTMNRLGELVIAAQKISRLNGEVISVEEIDDNLAIVPPKLIDFSWDRGQLTLIMDKTVDDGWINGLRNMGSYSSTMGAGPEHFTFRGNKAMVSAQPHQVQPIVDHFRVWLPKASARLAADLKNSAERKAAQLADQLDDERKHELAKKKLLETIKI